MPATATSNLKERVEETIVNLLSADTVLRALIPRKENEQDRPQRPFIAITAKVEKEMAFGLGLFRVPVAIDLYFDAKQPDQDSIALDECAQRVNSILAAAQVGQTHYGVMRDGESQLFEGELGRKRTIHLTVVAG